MFSPRAGNFISITNTSPFTPRTTSVITNGTNSNQNSDVLTMSPLLQSILNDLNVMSSFYTIGDYDSLKSLLTLNKYRALSASLGNLFNESGNDSVLNVIIQTAKQTLQGLQRAYMQNDELINVSQQYLLCMQRCDILDDMEKLQEYIRSLNNSRHAGAFGEYTISSTVPAKIPDEYLKYIIVYGYPVDGVFDSVRLANVSRLP